MPSHIFQLRIDFNSFVIAGPNTVTTTTLLEVNGGITSAAGKSVSTATQCQTDMFTITGGGGSNPPLICGTNTGQHGKGKRSSNWDHNKKIFLSHNVYLLSSYKIFKWGTLE